MAIILLGTFPGGVDDEVSSMISSRMRARVGVTREHVTCQGRACTFI